MGLLVRLICFRVNGATCQLSAMYVRDVRVACCLLCTLTCACSQTIPTGITMPIRYLAAPVLEDGARVRTVYLPRTDGGWAHYYTGAKYAGGANVTVPAPLDELPLFVRAGY